MADSLLCSAADSEETSRIANISALPHALLDHATSTSDVDRGDTIEYLIDSTPCLHISSIPSSTSSMAPTTVVTPEHFTLPTPTGPTLIVEKLIDGNNVTSTIFLAIFIATFVFRYFRTVISIGTWIFWRKVPVAKNPWRYGGQDCTVLIPTTFKAPLELAASVQRVMKCDPFEVFIITSNDNIRLVRQMCSANSFPKQIVRVLGVQELNKRHQILRALPCVKTKITVLADDDVFWPSWMYLNYLCAIFADPNVGAGGTRQRVVRNNRPSIVNMLGINYLERRVWNNCASNSIDGSISTLSGRTAAYRTSILKDPEFYEYFLNDSWRGKPLNSDDDKCLTRWVYKNGHKIRIQSDSRAVLETTVEPDIKGYNAQCLRWARAHWRGNFTVMENEKYWCSLKMWWGLYVIYISQFQTPAILCETILAMLLYCAVGASSEARDYWIALGCWIFVAKNLKMIPHYCRYPQDLIFVPALMMFSYYHGLLNIYAACTMTNTHWGNKTLAVDDESTTKRHMVQLVKKPFVTTCIELDPHEESARKLRYDWAVSQQLGPKEVWGAASCLVHDCFEHGCVKWAECDVPLEGDSDSEPPSESGSSSLYPDSSGSYVNSSDSSYENSVNERTALLSTPFYSAPPPPPTPAATPPRSLSPAAEHGLRRAGLRQLDNVMRTHDGQMLRSEDGSPIVSERVVSRLSRASNGRTIRSETAHQIVPERVSGNVLRAQNGQIIRSETGAPIESEQYPRLPRHPPPGRRVPYQYHAFFCEYDRYWTEEGKWDRTHSTDRDIRDAFASPFGFTHFRNERPYGYHVIRDDLTVELPEKPETEPGAGVSHYADQERDAPPPSPLEEWEATPITPQNSPQNSRASSPVGTRVPSLLRTSVPPSAQASSSVQTVQAGNQDSNMANSA